MPEMFVYILAHQTKYLDLVFAGLARQTRAPDHVVLTCDVENPALGEVASAWVDRVGCPISWVRRPHQGIARVAQIRNNAVRHLINDLGKTEGQAIQLDGDMVCSDTLVERHCECALKADAVYPYRINVSESRSAVLTAEGILDGSGTLEATADEMRVLRRRQLRYRKQLVMRKLRLGPMHKPKLLGCNWSGSLRLWRSINGFDERFQGWGFSDDEFARRAALSGASCVPAVDRIVAFHLYHTTRQPDGPMSSNPNHARFMRRDLPLRAACGLENPVEQDAVEVTVFG